MTTNSIARQPTGAPAGTGGEFAVTGRAQTGTTLSPAKPVARIDGDIVQARGVLNQALRLEREANLTHHQANVRRLRARDAVHLMRGRVPAELHQCEQDTKAAAAAAQVVHSDATVRVTWAGQQLAQASAQYPWAGSGVPVVSLADGAQRPVTEAPSGTYGFYETPNALAESTRRVVQIAQLIGDAWYPTPARYYDTSIAAKDPATSLWIDGGDNWQLPDEDLAAFIAFARDGATP